MKLLSQVMGRQASGYDEPNLDPQQRARELKQELQVDRNGKARPPTEVGAAAEAKDERLIEHLAKLEMNLQRHQGQVRQWLEHLAGRIDQIESKVDDLEQRVRVTDRYADTLKFIGREAFTAVSIALHEDDWLRDHKNLHQGERCFLLGCGPSLNKVDLTRLRGETVMGVNGTYSLEEVELTYFASVSHIFWRHHETNLKNLQCKRRFLPWHLRELKSDCPTSWFNFADRSSYHRLDADRHPWEFSFQPERVVFGGGTVIYACLQILYHLGFKEVILLGLDHDYGIDPASVDKYTGKYVGSGEIAAHFRDDYYAAGDKVHIDIHTMERAYAMAHQAFEADGRRLVNASPGTRLEQIPRVEFDTVCSP